MRCCLRFGEGVGEGEEEEEEEKAEVEVEDEDAGRGIERARFRLFGREVGWIFLRPPGMLAGFLPVMVSARWSVRRGRRVGRDGREGHAVAFSVHIYARCSFAVLCCAMLC